MDPFIEQLQAQVQQASQQGAKLQIRGRNSLGLSAKRPPESCLSLAGWQGVVEFEPGELAITVRSGTGWSELLAVLAQHGQQPACDPLTAGLDRTVGGVVATGFNGLARPWLGDVRGAVLGVAMLNGRGQLLTFGGRVMKNVAGFDLARLQAGAWGLFGPLLEISLRTRPSSQCRSARVLELSLEQALQRMYTMRTLPLTGLVWCDTRLHVRLEGLEPAVRQAEHELGGDADEPGWWQALERHRLPLFTTGPLYRILLPAGHALMPQLAGLGPALVDWGGAQLWLQAELTTAQRAAIRAAGGWCAQWPAAGPQFTHGSQRELTERLRHAFDPHRLFQPEFHTREDADADPAA